MNLFLQSSLSYNDSQGNPHHCHLVPHKDSLYSQHHHLFTQDDKSIIFNIRDKGFFTISAKQHLFWQIKILVQIYTYFRKDVNLIAYGEETERLVNLMSVL